MKVIFLADVPRVGKKHDVKDISDGYAANFLLPRKLAVVATPQALSHLERAQKEVKVQREIQDDLLVRNLEEIKGIALTIKGKANEKGSLFKAIHKKEIVDALKAYNRVEIGEDFIVLDKPIKELGEYEIPVVIKNKETSFKLTIEG